MRITIACPEALKDAANHYAMAVGASQADQLTFHPVLYEDGSGNRFACASLPIRTSLLTKAQSTLVRPAWDTGNIINMADAVAAQNVLVLVSDEDAEITATTTSITALIGDDGPAMITRMGLAPIEEDLE